MHKIGKTACALAAALALASGVTARADRMDALREQAKAPLHAEIEAYGRTIALDLTAEVPPVEALGVYLAQTQSVHEARGTWDARTLPEKRRGIAYRTKEPDVFTPETFEADYRAYGHPMTAQQALTTAWALFEPHLSQMPGVTARWCRMRCSSPYYAYDKNAGTWGDLVFDGATGAYQIDYDLYLYGVPLPYVTLFSPAGEFDENEWLDSPPFVTMSAHIDTSENGEAHTDASALGLPRVQETLAQDVDLAPLSAVFETLCETAREGYLRQAYSLKLCYMGFCYGERPQTGEEEGAVLVKPVWVCHAEAYLTPELEAYASPDGELWASEGDIVIDAQTGDWIRSGRVTAYP